MTSTVTTDRSAAGTAVRFDQPFGDPRITALADVVFNLALEVFQLRAEVAALGGERQPLSAAQRTELADEMVAALFAPFAEVAR